MKNLLFTNLFCAFVLMMLFSCQKNESNENNSAKQDKKPKTEATFQELQFLDNLFKNGQVEIVNKILKFRDAKSFSSFNNFINYLNNEQLEKFEIEKGYRSLYRFTYSISKEADPKMLLRENRHLYTIDEKGGLMSNMLLNKVTNENGAYYFGEDIIFNSKKIFISEHKNSNFEKFLNNLRSYFKNGVKTEKYTYLEYQQNDQSSRTCFLTSQTDFRDYTHNGTKWFRTTSEVFVGANPVRNSNGQILYWEWWQGWSHNITNFRVYWLYTTTSDAPLYIKTDAYITGNSNYQWMWQTCSNCSELEFSKITSNGTAPNESLIPGIPQFNPLIWFIGQVTQGVPVGQSVDCDTNDGQNHPSICYNCW